LTTPISERGHQSGSGASQIDGTTIPPASNDGIDVGLREAQRGDDRQAGRAGAQVEHPSDTTVVDAQRLEVLAQDFGDVGTRHDDPLVDAETQVAQPGLAGEVGGGDTFVDPAAQDVGERLPLVIEQAGIEKGFKQVERQAERALAQVDRFVPGAGVAVAEEHAGLLEAGDRKADEVAQRRKLLHGGDEGIAGRGDRIDTLCSAACAWGHVSHRRVQ
jgi:hypothetical protein